MFTTYVSSIDPLNTGAAASESTRSSAHIQCAQQWRGGGVIIYCDAPLEDTTQFSYSFLVVKPSTSSFPSRLGYYYYHRHYVVCGGSLRCCTVLFETRIALCMA